MESGDGFAVPFSFDFGPEREVVGNHRLGDVSRGAALRDNAASLSARRRCRALYGVEIT